MKRSIVTRPDGFDFDPGQGVELAIDRDRWRDEGRPFTPTSLPRDPVLEFTVQGYPDHEGVTDRMHTLEAGAWLRMSEPFGTIRYQGPGTFIAGGTGVTPFLAILRHLHAEGALDDCALLYSNRTPADVICEKELQHLLGDRVRLTCTRQTAPGYESRRIDGGYLEEVIDDLDRHFHVCGPTEMVEKVQEALTVLGAAPDRIVVED